MTINWTWVAVGSYLTLSFIVVCWSMYTFMFGWDMGVYI